MAKGIIGRGVDQGIDLMHWRKIGQQVEGKGRQGQEQDFKANDRHKGQRQKYLEQIASGRRGVQLVVDQGRLC